MIWVLLLRPSHLMLRCKKLCVKKAPVFDFTTRVILSIRPFFHICLNDLNTLYFVFMILFFFFLVPCDDIRRIYERNDLIRRFNGLIQFRGRWRGAKYISCRYCALQYLQWYKLRSLASALASIVITLTIRVKSLVLISFNFFFWRFFISLLLN